MIMQVGKVWELRLDGKAVEHCVVVLRKVLRMMRHVDLNISVHLARVQPRRHLAQSWHC